MMKPIFVWTLYILSLYGWILHGWTLYVGVAVWLGSMYTGDSGPAFAQEPVRSVSEGDSQLTFYDLEGNQHPIPCKKDAKCLVLVFINTECPIANAYHPTLTRIKEQFSDTQFDFVMIHADPTVSIDAARKHRQEYAITWPVALDPGNKIARRVNAKVTPEAIIIDPTGTVLYRGRIDDRHEDYGRKRPAPTTHDLQDALLCVRDNRPIQRSETKAIGCLIRYADE